MFRPVDTDFFFSSTRGRDPEEGDAGSKGDGKSPEGFLTSEEDLAGGAVVLSEAKGDHELRGLELRGHLLEVAGGQSNAP